MNEKTPGNPSLREVLHLRKEQEIYARVLDVSVKLGMILLAATFLAYLTGSLPARVPVERLPEYWGLSVDAYAAATGTPTGWAWLNGLDNGENLTLLGVAFLAGVTIVSYLAIIPTLVQRRDHAHALIAATEILVLVVTASGWVTLGH